MDAALAVRSAREASGQSVASTVSRIEAGSLDPTVATLQRILDAAGARLRVTTGGVTVDFAHPQREVTVSHLPDLMRRRKALVALAREHKATAIGIFGSAARGEDDEESDVDFLVDFAPGASLHDLVGLQQALEDRLGIKVDVVSRGGLLERDPDILDDLVLL